jgi:hypothetical protein
MIFSLPLLPIVGIVQPQNSEYTADIYDAEIIPTIDGKWTDASEWSDANEYVLDAGLQARFRAKKVTDNHGQLKILYFLVEFLNDTTNDLNDYTSISFAMPESVGEIPQVGSTLTENCKQFFYGDLKTNPLVYSIGVNNTMGWMDNSSYTWETDILVVDSFDVSPLLNENHSIMEWRISAPAFGIYPNFLLRVATVDEGIFHVYGSQIWPYSHNGIPEQWGIAVLHDEIIPEFQSWIILPLFLIGTLTILEIRKKLKNKELY